jgi:hypothetical protein
VEGGDGSGEDKFDYSMNDYCGRERKKMFPVIVHDGEKKLESNVIYCKETCEIFACK